MLPPPRTSGQCSVQSNTVALVLPFLKAPPWMASLTMRLGTSKDSQLNGIETRITSRTMICSRRLFCQT